jgi:hypothetical protein
MSQPLALDTTPSAERRQIEFFRTRTPEHRLGLAFELTAFAVAASRAAIRRAHPHLTELERARLLVALQFDAQRAAQICRVPSLEGSMAFPAAIVPVADAFDQLQVPYYIAGSIASTAYSLPRTTNDVDIVAALHVDQVAAFVSRLEPDYYIDRSSVLDAIAHRGTFNMTHQATGINIDVFIPAGRPFDREQFARAQGHVLPGIGREVKLASPEDVLLNKLAWYELGNRVSDVQWRDVQSILRVQGEALDIAYMHRWAAELQVSDLLEAALRGERPATPPDSLGQGRLF